MTLKSEVKMNRMILRTKITESQGSDSDNCERFDENIIVKNHRLDLFGP